MSTSFHTPSLIEKKRDGHELSTDEIHFLIDNFTDGSLPDYQMSAFAMAVHFSGMTPRETTDLTTAMMQSGSVFSYPADSPPKVDKHSTGGIGDKVSLILAPLLACEGLWVPMISGRGLGITGGTLDKLESIPGFRVDLSPGATLTQLELLGVVMIGQTPDICPADKKLYALRDVTATVPSQPLIIASIMSKKLAESLDRLVLDVKFGSGAFMKTREEAEELGNGLCAVGNAMGVDVRQRLTPMHEPLGHTVGNALEVAEAVETLQGKGPADLTDLVLDLAGEVCDASREQLANHLTSGTAWSLFMEMVAAQGGQASALTQIRDIHHATHIGELRADRSGVVQQVDALTVGKACVNLGAGRQQASDTINPSVGCDEIIKCGSQVNAGDALLRIHASSTTALDQALTEIRHGIEIE